MQLLDPRLPPRQGGTSKEEELRCLRDSVIREGFFFGDIDNPVSLKKLADLKGNCKELLQKIKILIPKHRVRGIFAATGYERKAHLKK